MKKKYDPCDLITTAGLLIVIFGFSLATFLTPDVGFSEDENRMLQQKPKFSLTALADGSFTKQIADYCSDQIPLRGLFVGTKSVMELALQKQENDDVLLGKNGVIAAKDDYPDYAQIDKNLKAVNRFAGALGDDITFDIAIAGRVQDVLAESLPALYPAKEVTKKTFSYVYEKLDGPRCIELLEPLKARADAGEYVYYRTDHHCTTLGAYYAYVELMKAWGMEPHPLDYFTVETASTEFYGTTWSKAGMRWTEPDTIELFRYPGDSELLCEMPYKDSVPDMDGLYDRSYLSVKDKYSVFISGNNALTEIYPAKGSPLDTGKREKLVLIKDSFGHSLAPFLAAHFDLEIIDLRYFRTTPTIDFVKETGAKRVLILCNMDSIVNSDSLVLLNLGIK